MATTQATGSTGKDAFTAAQAEQDASAKHTTRSFKIWRGEAGKGEFVEYKQDVVEGMVVLDAVHEIAHVRERAHRLDRHRLVRIKISEPRHAHQLWHAVDLGGA